MGKDNDMARERNDSTNRNQAFSTTETRELIQRLRAEGDISAPASLLPAVLSRLGLPATNEQNTGLDADLALAYCSKGDNYSSIKRYEEALTAYDQALSLDPSCALAYKSKGDVLRSLNRDEEAQAAYEQALHLGQNDLRVRASGDNVVRKLEDYRTNAVAYDEQGLVRRAQNGDQIAFEILYERYNSRISRYLCRMTGSDGVGTELTQDTFLKAWEALSGLRIPARFASWLYRIATNRAYDYQHRAGHAHEVPWEGYRAEMEKLSVPGSEEQLAKTELLHRALALVSPTYRPCLILYVIEEFSRRQIADLLQIKESSVSKYVSRGKWELREIYTRLAREHNIPLDESTYISQDQEELPQVYTRPAREHDIPFDESGKIEKKTS